jgi:hypothetical protein
VHLIQYLEEFYVMKYVILFLFFPQGIFSQKILCMDTVTETGYMYRYINTYLLQKGEISDTADNFYFFIPERMLGKQKVSDIIAIIENGENDTAKYLSYKPRKDLSQYLNPDCRMLLAQAIDVRPFVSAQPLFRIKSSRPEWWRVQFCYLRIQWLKLRMTNNIACWEGLDYPATLLCDTTEPQDVEVYIPINLLETQPNVRFKNNKLFHSARKIK